MHHPIKEYFKGRTYQDLRALALHTKEISEAINKQPKRPREPYKPPRELTEFDLQVCELAPSFRWGEKFKTKEIAKTLPQSRKPSLEEMKRLTHQVSLSIMALKAHGKLTNLPEEPTPLSTFQQQVLDLAPRFITPKGKYKILEIAKAIAGQTSNEIDWEIVNKAHRKVQSAFNHLREQGLIKKGVKNIAIKQRVAREEDIEGNAGLIHATLNRGHRYLPKDWRAYISREEAAELGQIALVRAIEAHDPTKGTLSNYAFCAIAGKIGAEVRKRRRHGLPVSLDQPQRPDDERTLYDKLGTPAKEDNMPKEALEHMFRLYQRRKIKPSHAAIWTLRHVFGHTLQEIGDHFKVKRQRIKQIEDETNLRLRFKMR
ncbi:MAG: sigma factor-like helix-turn-helix DNA-binding protein [Candidatus Micrarchaeota archaeon]